MSRDFRRDVLVACSLILMALPAPGTGEVHPLPRAGHSGNEPEIVDRVASPGTPMGPFPGIPATSELARPVGGSAAVGGSSTGRRGAAWAGAGGGRARAGSWSCGGPPPQSFSSSTEWGGDRIPPNPPGEPPGVGAGELARLAAALIGLLAGTGLLLAGLEPVRDLIEAAGRTGDRFVGALRSPRARPSPASAGRVLVLANRDRPPGGTCPVCGEVFLAGNPAPLVRCRRCEVPAHGECWEYQGGCAIFGCGAG